jgi:hypothetical protein
MVPACITCVPPINRALMPHRPLSCSYALHPHLAPVVPAPAGSAAAAPAAAAPAASSPSPGPAAPMRRRDRSSAMRSASRRFPALGFPSKSATSPCSRPAPYCIAKMEATIPCVRARQKAGYTPRALTPRTSHAPLTPARHSKTPPAVHLQFAAPGTCAHVAAQPAARHRRAALQAPAGCNGCCCCCCCCCCWRRSGRRAAWRCRHRVASPMEGLAPKFLFESVALGLLWRRHVIRCTCHSTVQHRFFQPLGRLLWPLLPCAAAARGSSSSFRMG